MAFLQRVQVPYTPFFYFLFPSRSNLDEFNKLLSYLTYQGFRYLQYALLLCLENDEYLRSICNSFLKDNPSHGFPSLQLKVPAKFKINKPAAFCTYYSEVIIWHPMYPRQSGTNSNHCLLILKTVSWNGM